MNMWHHATSERGLFDRDYKRPPEYEPEWVLYEAEPPESTRPVSSRVWLGDEATSPETRRLGDVLKGLFSGVALGLAVGAIASAWIAPELGATQSVAADRAILTDGLDESMLYAIHVRSQVANETAPPPAPADRRRSSPPINPQGALPNSDNPYGPAKSEAPPEEPQSDNPY